VSSASSTSISVTGATSTPAAGQLVSIAQCSTGVVACGYVNTNGTTTVTLFTGGLNGTPFYSGLAGQTIAINKVNYTISSVTNATTLVTTATVPSSGGTGFAVGTPTDNGAIFVCGLYTLPTCQTETISSTNQPYGIQNQVLLITAVSGSAGNYTLTVSPGLYMPNWGTQSSAGTNAYWFTPTIGAAVEDLTLMSPASSNYLNASNNINGSYTYASWVKGVRSLSAGINWYTAKSSLTFNDYFAPDISFVLNSSYSGYQRSMSQQESSDMLFLNNISAIGIPQAWSGGDAGIVTAYNFGRDAFTGYGFNLLSYDHAAYGSFDLFEGNQAGMMHEDDTWGTHDLNTYFRNNLSCYDSPYAGGGGSPYAPNSHGFYIGVGQRFDNLIANAVGVTLECPTYYGTGAGSAFQYNNADSMNTASLMRWGNVTVDTQSSDTPPNSGVRFVSSEVPATINPNTYCTGSGTPYSGCTGSGTGTNSATTWQNSVPSNDNLPCSFYFSIGSSPCSPKYSGGTGLSWYKVCKTWTTFPTSCATTQTQPFPIAGPELTSGPYVNGYSYDNPAAVAWQNLPIDTTFQNSYTISSSSWSNSSGTCSPAPAPCETLTFAGSVLPNVNHMQGAFQLSGVNSACSTGATFNSAGEIYVTNSSSTTVVYSLPSNPSVSCTGSMLFPDVRQFDERVYQADPASGGASGSVIGGGVVLSGGAAIQN